MKQHNSFNVLETYEKLLSKATTKFNKLIDRGTDLRHSQDTNAAYTRTFNVYNELWRFQQTHRCARTELVASCDHC